VWVGAEKRDSRSNKETDQESKKGRKIAALKPFDNKSPASARGGELSARSGRRNGFWIEQRNKPEATLMPTFRDHDT
jgi:hypothetical protein